MCKGATPDGEHQEAREELSFSLKNRKAEFQKNYLWGKRKWTFNCQIAYRQSEGRKQFWKQDNEVLGGEEDRSDLAKSILGAVAKSEAGPMWCKIAM